MESQHQNSLPSSSSSAEDPPPSNVFTSPSKPTIEYAAAVSAVHDDDRWYGVSCERRSGLATAAPRGCDVPQPML